MASTDFQQESDSAQSNHPRQPNQSSASKWAMLLLTLAVVLVPLVISWIPNEIGHWHYATAEESALDTNYEQAIRSIDAAIKWAPQQADLYLRRAQFRIETGEFQSSLEDCNRALELSNNNTQVNGVRAGVYQRLEMHEAAVADLTVVINEIEEALAIPGAARWFNQDYSTALNNRAYYRAIGMIELEEAMADIDKALPLRGKDDYVLLDTRGYLHYLAGDYEKARVDLEAAVNLCESEFQIESQRDQEKIEARVDRRNIQQQVKRREENLSVIYHHRGLVYEKLDNQKQAQMDLDRAKELGYNPAAGVM